LTKEEAMKKILATTFGGMFPMAASFYSLIAAMKIGEAGDSAVFFFFLILAGATLSCGISIIISIMGMKDEKDEKGE
jgi:hypothetical protein